MEPPAGRSGPWPARYRVTLAVIGLTADHRFFMRLYRGDSR